MADELSKWEDHGNWMLMRGPLQAQVQQAMKNAGMSRQEQKRLWPPQVDLFASKRAHIVARYVSAVFDGTFERVDAFACDWTTIAKGGAGYAYPPPEMRGEALEKIATEKPTVWLVCQSNLPGKHQTALDRIRVVLKAGLNIRKGSGIVPTDRNPAKARKETWRSKMQLILCPWEC